MGGAMAVPYEVVEPVFIVLVAALVLLILAAPRLAGMGRLFRGPRFRIVTGTILAVVVGGGNAARLTSLPPGVRLGDNANAFVGGFRLWQEGGLKT